MEDDDYDPTVHNNDIEPQIDLLVQCFSAGVRDLRNLYSHFDPKASFFL
jgi:hypothetical protein